VRTGRKDAVRLAAAGTGMLAVLVFASPAVAHARLLGSTPEDRGTVTEPITEIRLRFSGPVKQSLTTVRSPARTAPPTATASRSWSMPRSRRP
jgi:methionine-rich copper-binding protein CopC